MTQSSAAGCPPPPPSAAAVSGLVKSRLRLGSPARMVRSRCLE